MLVHTTVGLAMNIATMNIDLAYTVVYIIISLIVALTLHIHKVAQLINNMYCGSQGCEFNTLRGKKSFLSFLHSILSG